MSEHSGGTGKTPHRSQANGVAADANVKAVQRMLGHASGAMTLDVYDDLFDSDLDAVAENVGKMWARGGQTTARKP